MYLEDKKDNKSAPPVDSTLKRTNMDAIVPSKNEKNITLFHNAIPQRYVILKSFQKFSINHIDRNQSNNELTNLEFTTTQSNVRHSFQTNKKKKKIKKERH